MYEIFYKKREFKIEVFYQDFYKSHILNEVKNIIIPLINSGPIS